MDWWTSDWGYEGMTEKWELMRKFVTVFVSERVQAIDESSVFSSYRTLGLAGDALVEEAKKEEEEARKIKKSNFLVSQFKRWNSKTK